MLLRIGDRKELKPDGGGVAHTIVCQAMYEWNRLGVIE